METFESHRATQLPIGADRGGRHRANPKASAAALATH
jgi:hypothetical protein